ncbi:hypothetical protein VdG2_06555 [Verticillium dahliae VDG2]|nr:hypothetical protein VdG2_06555 [Verticillium dahliae VDG2]
MLLSDLVDVSEHIKDFQKREKCNKGGCVGGSGEVKSSTTRATTSATTPVTATDREITTSTSSTTSIASVPTTTTLTLPTLVPRIDNFVNKGCFYVANLKRRVLRADSTVDASNTGDAKQLCGDGNRIQVYQDETWFMPTIQQLVEDLKAYNETLKEARSAVAQYKEDLEEYQKIRQGSSKVRRANDDPRLVARIPLTERERKILERLVGGFKNLNRIQASIKPFAPKIIRGYKIAKRYDINVAGPTRVDEETANALEAAVQSSIESFQRPVDAAAADSAQAEPALEMDILPDIDVTAHLDIASTAIDKIGIAAVAGRVATGISHKCTVSRTICALLSIQRYVYDNNLFGRSVISMSFSLPVASLWWEDPRTQGAPVTKYADPYLVYLPEFMAQGIVAVASAGNDALKEDEVVRDLSYSTPRAAGGRDSGLIVVGNAQYDGSRNLKSQHVDVRRKGILSLYSIGTDVDCAGTESVSNEAGGSGQTWKHQSGTSPATAITAGMAAYLLSYPVIGPQLRAGGNGQVAMNVKNYLINTGQTLKGDAATGDGVPPGSVGGDGRLDIRIFSTRDITDGQNVFVNANCWDLQ